MSFEFSLLLVEVCSIIVKVLIINLLKVYKNQNCLNIQLDSTSLVEAQERRTRFLLEFEKPFKCEKCGERFKKKKYLREHKEEAHSY
jgi:uncharacterized Zn-finger protein